jgi:putative intracellular protease/amidase
MTGSANAAIQRASGWKSSRRRTLRSKMRGGEVTVASIAGGAAPIDPKSDLPEWATADTKRFKVDDAARQALSTTISAVAAAASHFDALFFPGGHGPMWDFPENSSISSLLTSFDGAAKPIGAVCHGPAAFLTSRAPKQPSFVEGRRITAFTDTEERKVGLEEIVPFSLEQRLIALGGQFERGADFTPFVVIDRNLVTGQNPASSRSAAAELIRMLT